MITLLSLNPTVEANERILNLTASTLFLSGDTRVVNLSNNTVIVTGANRSLYMANDNNYTGTDDGVKLLFDGSGGGEVCQHMQLNTAPYNTDSSAIKPISDIAFPKFGSGVLQDVTLTINVAGVQFSDSGDIAANVGSLSKT